MRLHAPSYFVRIIVTCVTGLIGAALSVTTDPKGVELRPYRILCHAALLVITWSVWSNGDMAAVREKSQLMSASEIDRTLVRLAHEILEKTENLEKLALLGIRRRGVPIAQRLAKKVESIEKNPVLVGSLDISLYRDDLSLVATQPVVNSTDIPFSITGLDVILVDDVLYTGRTARAALNALFDHGRPARVQLLSLIDRGHRELPVEARYIGRTIQTTQNEIIEVRLKEVDSEERVVLMEKLPESV